MWFPVLTESSQRGKHIARKCLGSCAGSCSYSRDSNEPGYCADYKVLQPPRRKQLSALLGLGFVFTDWVIHVSNYMFASCSDFVCEETFKIQKITDLPA